MSQDSSKPQSKNVLAALGDAVFAAACARFRA
jgi:hypothetical protein